MYLSPIFVKKGEHNAPNTEKDGMDVIKGMQPQKTDHPVSYAPKIF